jgi:deoxyadenosine/deoxycytidine kinase
LPDPENELTGQLVRFYKDRRKNALNLQMAFLKARSRDLSTLRDKAGEETLIILDYFLDNEKIFSALNLTEVEKRFYDEEYDKAREGIPEPDLVIYLKASPGTLAERVERRGSKLSQQLSADYLADVARAFEEYMNQYRKAPILAYDTDALDFSEGGKDIPVLVKEVKEKLSLE